MGRRRNSPAISVIFLLVMIIAMPALAQNPPPDCKKGFAKLWATVRDRFSQPVPSVYERLLDEAPQEIERELESVQGAVKGSLSERMFRGLKVNVAQKTAVFPSIESMNEVAGFARSNHRARFVSYPGNGATDPNVYQRSLARGDIIIAQHDMHDLVAHAVGMKYLVAMDEWMAIRQTLTECYRHIDAAKSPAATKAFEEFAVDVSEAIDVYTTRFSNADRTADWDELENAKQALQYRWEHEAKRFKSLTQQYANSQ